MTDLEYVDLDKAIALYIQKGEARWPQSDKMAVAKEFGEKEAAVLISQIEGLATEMRMIEVDLVNHSLTSARDLVREETRKRYPRLSSDALDALAWKWAFENR